MNPKISVIMPVYNAERFLKKRMGSILEQTFKDFELICINDGSTDQSLKMLNEYSAKDSRVRIINQPNSGPAVARNLGLQHAKGYLVTFFDSDDYCDSNLFEKVIAREDSCDADILIVPVKGFDDTNQDIFDMKWAFQSEHFPSDIFNYKDAPNYIFNSFQNWLHNKFFKRDFLAKNHLELQNLRHTEDLLFTCSALVLAKKIALVPKAFTYYRVGNPNSQMNSAADMPLDFYKADCALKDFLINNKLYETVFISYINWMADCVLTNLNNASDSKTYTTIFDCLKNGGLHELDLDSVEPIVFHDDYYYKGIKAILENDAIGYLLAMRRDAIDSEVKNAVRLVRSSKSYRIGNALLALPAKIKHLRD